MLLETAKDQICINQIIGQKKEVVDIEGDVIVNDVKPDVLSIISSNGTVLIYKKEVMDGKIRLDGSINTYIMYLADNDTNDVRSLNTVLDFTHFMDIANCGNGMFLDEDVKIKNFECNILNSRKITIKANLEIEAKVLSNENIDVISQIDSIDDIQTLKTGSSVNSLLGVNSSKTYCKDNISIDSSDDIAEIMKTKCRITNKEAKISYNKVLVKADCDVDIMYLTEDNRISSVNAKLPVMGFVDIPDIHDENICDVKCKLKNILVKPEKQESTSLYIEAEIEIICFVYETKSIDIIEDLYSLSSDLKCKEKKIRTTIGKERVRDKCAIKEQVHIPEVGSSQIYSVDVIPTINSMDVYNGKVLFEGNLGLELLYNSESNMTSKSMQIPFKFEMASTLIDENTTVEPDIELDRDNFTILSDGNIEADIVLTFDLSISKQKDLSIIEEIEMEEAQNNNYYSMVIYFVKPNDTLWNVAKKMRSTVDDIRKINELESDKITAGQQLYIPKSVKKIAV